MIDDVAANLVPLPVLLPLLGAALSLAVRRSPLLQRVTSTVALTGLVVVAAILVVVTDRQGPQVLWVGAWKEPLGISLVADRLSALMLLVSGVVILVVLIFSIAQGQEDDETDTPMTIFHPTYLVLAAGVSNAFLAGDLFNLFVGFEILLYASYVLLTLGGAEQRIHAGTTYVVVSLISSSIFLIGIAATYAATGTVNLAQLAIRLGGVEPGVLLVLQLCLLTAFAIKAAVFPLSAWLPDSYPTAPAPVTAVFAGLLTKVGVYAMIRVQTLLFPESPLHGLLMWAALLTMVIGILGAVSQSGLKRILSFTLVSHIGYMVFGIALGTAHGMAGAIFYVVHHITIQTALFLIAGLVERLGGTTSLDRLAGLAVASPVLSILFFVAAMNLSGIPPLSGFLAKIGLFHAGIEFGTPLSWALVAGGIVTSLLTLYALAKVWSQAFWRPIAETPAPAEVAAALASGSVGVPADVDPATARTTVLTETPSTSRAMPPLMLAATATMTAVGLVITLAAGPLFAYTQRAAADLKQRTPYITSVLPPEVRR
ncbi:monovalent cation/H+ antiporter subunit D [Intrasporangium chromatireducens Q5-1]|uniref:Monovalent cation/H+ antiporter subunit D n=1 Tax=Intrasporangium chromatireducens Q5-1 TaxID=584657 RepID=W9GQI8_9MICO|nr:Na+/H+ antiporter subunit D [Intrasporangium chromatireducens]EWT07342.1 monovalent cation/H+ antiporter subunit D [Intrasporangium chromatireducens Q5-1]